MAWLIPVSYLALSAGFFANVWPAATTQYAGSIPDALQLTWFLSYTAHALAHHQSLLFTSLLNAPAGVNLMWNTPMLLLGIAASPVTLTLGPVLAYNLLITLAIAGSAWAAYAAVHRLTRNRAAAFVAGLLFAFSPYMVAQALGHLDLVFLVYPPLVLILFVDIVVWQRWTWWVAGIALGLLTAAQLFVMEEVIIAVGMTFLIGLVMCAIQWRSRIAAHWSHVAKTLAVAAGVTLVCAGWPLWYQLTGPQTPPGLSEVANTTGSDLLGFVTPTANQLLSPAIAHQTAATFAAQTTGQDAYIGLPLLVLLALVVWTFWGRPHIRLLAIASAALLILSMGSQLHVLGRALPVPLPWRVFEHLPVVSNLVPLRLTAFAFLLTAAVVACALAELPQLGRARALCIAALTLASLVTWFPALPRPVLAAPPALPHQIAQRIPDGATVLFAPLPSLSTADAMYYQSQAGFRFSLLSGYAYERSPAIPFAHALESGSSVAVGAATQTVASAATRDAALHGYRDLGVRAIVVTPGKAAAAYTEFFSALLQRPPVSVAGFAVWALPPT